MQIKADTLKNGVKRIVKKIRSSGKRQKLTMLSACFLVYVMLLAGIFSYFHSEDQVTNRMTAPQGSVTIQEPNWDSTGQSMAKASEPGMKIPKDPSGVNNGQVDVYIRLAMTVDVSKFNSKNATYDSNYRYSEEERVRAILNAIDLQNDTDFLNATGTNNTKFIMDYDQTQNIYYFYYTDGNANMKIVKPGEKTSDLFDHIDIPVYKKDYLGVFDQPYNIILTAEGIPVGSNTVMTVEEAKSQFQKSA